MSSSSIISTFDLSPEHTNSYGSDNSGRTSPPDVQLNWLSRFLHIKPASKTLCFHIGRGKVRQDLVRLLRDWQRFGVRDVSFDRKTNVINARIDKNNRTYIPNPYAKFVFSEWRLQNWGFEVELLDTNIVLRCKSAFVSVSHSVSEGFANINLLQISRANLCPSLSNSSSYSNTVDARSCA